MFLFSRLFLLLTLFTASVSIHATEPTDSFLGNSWESRFSQGWLKPVEIPAGLHPKDSTLWSQWRQVRAFDPAQDCQTVSQQEHCWRDVQWSVFHSTNENNPNKKSPDSRATLTWTAQGHLLSQTDHFSWSQNALGSPLVTLNGNAIVPQVLSRQGSQVQYQVPLLKGSFQLRVSQPILDPNWSLSARPTILLVEVFGNARWNAQTQRIEPLLLDSGATSSTVAPVAFNRASVQSVVFWDHGWKLLTRWNLTVGAAQTLVLDGITPVGWKPQSVRVLPSRAVSIEDQQLSMPVTSGQTQLWILARLPELDHPVPHSFVVGDWMKVLTSPDPTQTWTIDSPHLLGVIPQSLRSHALDVQGKTWAAQPNANSAVRWDLDSRAQQVFHVSEQPIFFDWKKVTQAQTNVLEGSLSSWIHFDQQQQTQQEQWQLRSGSIQSIEAPAQQLQSDLLNGQPQWLETLSPNTIGVREALLAPYDVRIVQTQPKGSWFSFERPLSSVTDAVIEQPRLDLQAPLGVRLLRVHTDGVQWTPEAGSTPYFSSLSLYSTFLILLSSWILFQLLSQYRASALLMVLLLLSPLFQQRLIELVTFSLFVLWIAQSLPKGRLRDSAHIISGVAMVALLLVLVETSAWRLGHLIHASLDRPELAYKAPEHHATSRRAPSSVQSPSIHENQQAIPIGSDLAGATQRFSKSAEVLSTEPEVFVSEAADILMAPMTQAAPRTPDRAVANPALLAQNREDLPTIAEPPQWSSRHAWTLRYDGTVSSEALLQIWTLSGWPLRLLGFFWMIGFWWLVWQLSQHLRQQRKPSSPLTPTDPSNASIAVSSGDSV